jgi:hypothetical protein
MSFAGKWMTLGIIMSSEINQLHKDIFSQVWNMDNGLVGRGDMKVKE